MSIVEMSSRHPAVDAATHDVAGVAALSWFSVDGKWVEFRGSFPLEPLAHSQFEEITECLALSATSR